MSQQDQPGQWRNQACRQSQHRHQRAAIEQDMPLVGGQTHQPRQHAEIPRPTKHQQHRQRQQHAEEAKHQMRRKYTRHDERDQRQSSIKSRLLLPSTRNQHAECQGWQYVEGVGIVNEHPIRHFTDHTEQQQPAQIPPLTSHWRLPHPVQIRRNCQAEPRERQTPRYIQPVQVQTDIAQVVEHHAQQRQPFEQVEGAIADAAYRNRFSTVHNSPVTLH